MTTSVILLVTARSAIAADGMLFKPLDSLSLRNPTSTQPYPEAYAASEAKATWNIVSWKIPAGNLPPFTTHRSGSDQVFSSVATEAQVQLMTSRGSSLLELSQDGDVLPCQTESGSPRESDLFAHPNLKDTENERSAYLFDPAKTSIGQFSRLVIRGSVGVGIAPAKSSPCGVSQASVMVGVTLTNRSSHQTLFYQLALAQGCGPQDAKRDRQCQSAHASPKPHFFSRQNPFGADDSLPLIGKAFLSNDDLEPIEIDILQRLIYFLRTGPDNLDKSTDNWQLQGLTIGQNIWGGMHVRSRWKDVNLYGG